MASSRKILVWIYHNYGTRAFKRSDVGKMMAIRNIGGFIQNLQKWGCVKYVDRTAKGWAGYVLTEWGRKMAERWSKTQ